MNSFKKGEGVPLLNFEGGPGVLVLNFEDVPGPGSRGPGSRDPGPTFTPCHMGAGKLFRYCQMQAILTHI